MSAERYERAARELGKGFLSDAYARGGLAPDGAAPGIDAAGADPSAQNQETGLRPGAEFKTPFGEDARRELHQRAGNDGFIQSNLVASRVASPSERTHREREKRGGSKDEMFRFYLMTMRRNLQGLADRIAQDLEHWRKELQRIGGELEELGHDLSSIKKADEHLKKTGGMALGPDGKPIDPRLQKFIDRWEKENGRKFDPENPEQVHAMLSDAEEFCKTEEARLKGEQTHAQTQHDQLEEDAVKVDSAIRKIDEADTPEERLKVLRDFSQDEILQQLMAEHGLNDDTAFDLEALQALDLDETGFEDFGFESAPDMKSAFDKASSGEASANIGAPENGPATDQNRTSPTVVKFDF